MRLNTLKEYEAPPLKVWLDDERPAPDGWTPVRWPEEAISLINKGNVSHISLDHDLGDDDHGTGYDVLLWVEEQVHINPDFVLPDINIHTANPSASDKMHRALDSIKKYYNT